MDDRIKVLAHNLVNYSMNVQNGEKVFVHYTGPTTEPLARQIIKEVYKVVEYLSRIYKPKSSKDAT